MENQEDLQRIGDLVALFWNAELEVKEAESSLKTAKETLREISEEYIPELFDEMGIREIKAMVELHGKSIPVTINVKEAYYPSIKDVPAFHQWLREQGAADIIKNEVKVAFGKGQDKDAAILMSDLVIRGLTPEQKEGIHSSTLKSFIKSEIEKGTAIPDSCAVHIKPQTKIKKG